MDVNYAGCDWLTMTTKDDRVGAQWYEMYQKYRKQRWTEGNEEQTFHNGFYGGVRIAHMSVGHSDTIGFIVIVSGGDAERLYQRLKPVKHKVTRLDLCFDFTFKSPIDLAGKVFQELKEISTNKQRKFTFVQGYDGGNTLYLGSRQSMQFGRLYDKGVEKGAQDPGLFWRAEVEYKKPMAGAIAKGLSKVKPGGRELAICDTVSEWFNARDATLFPGDTRKNAIHVSVEQRVTTAEKKLAWLRGQVSPTVVALIEAGHGHRVLECLMLDTHAITKCWQEKT